MYSLRRYFIASVLAPLASLPVAFCVVVLSALLVGPTPRTPELIGGSLFLSLYALPAAYAAALLVSGPVVLVARHREWSISAGAAASLGLLGGALGAVAFLVASGPHPTATELTLAPCIGLPSGLVSGLLFRALLRPFTGA